MNDLDVVPGQAGSGTRIRLNFSNIPAGWTLTLPAHGFGFLSQFGNPYSGLSYLAIVLPNSTRIDSIGQ